MELIRDRFHSGRVRRVQRAALAQTGRRQRRLEQEALPLRLRIRRARGARRPEAAGQQGRAAAVGDLPRPQRLHADIGLAAQQATAEVALDASRQVLRATRSGLVGQAYLASAFLPSAIASQPGRRQRDPLDLPAESVRPTLAGVRPREVHHQAVHALRPESHLHVDVARVQDALVVRRVGSARVVGVALHHHVAGPSHGFHGRPRERLRAPTAGQALRRVGPLHVARRAVAHGSDHPQGCLSRPLLGVEGLGRVRRAERLEPLDEAAPAFLGRRRQAVRARERVHHPVERVQRPTLVQFLLQFQVVIAEEGPQMPLRAQPLTFEQAPEAGLIVRERAGPLGRH